MILIPSCSSLVTMKICCRRNVPLLLCRWLMTGASPAAPALQVTRSSLSGLHHPEPEPQTSKIWIYRKQSYFSTAVHMNPSSSSRRQSNDKSDDSGKQEVIKITKSAIRKMKIADIREDLATRGLDVEGKKDELVERLYGALNVTSSNERDTEKSPNPQQDTNNPSEEESNDFLDPELTYLIRIKNAASGQMQCVKGIGTGITLRVFDEHQKNNTREQAILDMNQLLLPGARKPFDADYCALIMAMHYARSRGIQKIVVEINDVGIVRQLTGQGRVGTEDHQQKLHKEAMELANSFQSFEVRHYNGEDKCPQTESLAKTALAMQKPLQSDWELVDPLTDTPTKANNKEVLIDPTKKYLLKFDGGARDNPRGIAGAGMVIYDENMEEVWCGWKFLGKAMTNNVAEYNALIEGLKCARILGVRNICVEGDSMLAVKQIRGEYKIKASGLRPLCDEVMKLKDSFDSFKISAIPRAENSRADYLANHAMAIQESQSAEEML